MNDLTTFTNAMFGEIRATVIDGEPWFVGKDVAEALGYKRARGAIAIHVHEDDALKQSLTDSLGRKQEATFINESGLYALIFGSKLPSSKQFKRWVTSEVLPQIRKTGGYIHIEQDDTDELILSKALKIADATIKRKDEIIAQKDKLLEEQQPMVENYKILMDTKGTFSMNEVAHFCGIGEYYLFKYLRDIGILFYNNNKDNVPYENTVNKTKFRVVPAIAPDGSTHSVTRVLPGGIDYICKQLKKYGYLGIA